MPRSKTGKKRDPVDSTALKEALETVHSNDPDKKLSFREAARVFGVNRMTLSRHAHTFRDCGAKDFEYFTNYAVKKVFSEYEEESLLEYIQTVAKMQYGLSKKGVRLLAYKFAKANNKKIPESWDREEIAGEEWMRGFLKRHSRNLSLRKPEATSLSRATSFNRHNVECFYNNLKEVHNRFGPISPEKIWNSDETGLSTVQGQSKIVAPKGMKQVGSATSAERGQLITMIAAVNAVGNSLPPMLIFPRVFFKERMLFGGPPGCIGIANPSGWSNEDIFVKYLDHFLGFVKCSKEDRVILIVDNHETHLSIEALEKASAAGIVIVTFPPHTSHKLQPLDISVYGPLKTYYNQAVEAWLYNHVGKTFDIYSVAEALGVAYPRAFTPQNILSGFRKPGIYPLDTGVFTDEDFLSAYITDRPIESQTSVNITDISDSCQETSGGQNDLTSKHTDEPTPGTSNSQNNNHGAVTPNTKTTPIKNFVTPEEIQPYPKAPSRKARFSRRGRRAGRTMIATDTPEKEVRKEIKEKRIKKLQGDENKRVKKFKSPARVLQFSRLKETSVAKKKYSDKKQNPRKPIKRQKMLTKQLSSESEDEDPVPFQLTDDDTAGDECLYCFNSKEADRSGEEWCRCTSCGRWSHYLCAGVEGNEWETYICDFCNRK